MLSKKQRSICITLIESKGQFCYGTKDTDVVEHARCDICPMKEHLEGVCIEWEFLDLYHISKRLILKEIFNENN